VEGKTLIIPNSKFGNLEMQPGQESDGADKPPTQAASAVDLALAKTPEGNKSEYVSPGGKRRSNRQSPKCSDAKDNLSADDSMSMIGTATFVEGFDQVPGGKRRRKKFSTSRRREVASVRKSGACLTCRTRKVKVCQSVLNQSKCPCILRLRTGANCILYSAPIRYSGAIYTGIRRPHRSLSHNHIL
jgi:hypothetical protein